MICPNCGKEITDESTSCQFCGSAVTTQAQPEFGNNYEAAPQAAPFAGNLSVSQPPVDRKSVSKKEFIEKYAPAALKKQINSAAILCYFCSAVTIVFSFLTNEYWYFSLIDVAILLGLALGMHLGKSKACAIVLLVVSILEVVFTAVSTGTVAGWWWIIAAFSAVSAFNKLGKEYNRFLLEGYEAPMNMNNAQ